MNIIVRKERPRLPLEGRLDLTYRCNNNCLHCWLWLPPGASQGKEELSFAEIHRIVDEARSMGCQAWAISGGEPMLRPDFAEIFDYITRKAVSYRLNTNGTLITPEIARLLVRKGRKMVALYGATEEVHDRVTRNAGSFEAAMRGFAYLKEAGVSYEVQIVPMRDNYHQYGEMLALAETLSPHYRVGAPWLWLSACGTDSRNRQIARQRLDPSEVLFLDEPEPSFELMTMLDNRGSRAELSCCDADQGDDRLFSACIAARRDFHIDPYGWMSFCYYIKDRALRFNLREGSFGQAWDEFIPSLADSVHGGPEYLENCGICNLRQDCRWCGVYGYLEHGRYSAKVEYLCQVAAQSRIFKEDWKLEHLLYFQIAGINIQVSTDFPINDDTFVPKYKKFQVDGPGEDTISLRLVSSVPAKSELRLGKEVYRYPPWAIYQQGRSWVYLGITTEDEERDPYSVSIFSEDHSRGMICNPKDFYKRGKLDSLTTFTSDQILLARILAYRNGCILHAAGMNIGGQGLLFVGHSGAGKSTMLKLLRGRGDILCDDRIILRRWAEGFKIHGTWSNGELPDVSPDSAPLQAILFLEQAKENELIPIRNKRELIGQVLSHVVKPLVDANWWHKTLTVVEQIAREVPAYRLRFDKSGDVWNQIHELLQGTKP